MNLGKRNIESITKFGYKKKSLTFVYCNLSSGFIHVIAKDEIDFIIVTIYIHMYNINEMALLSGQKTP